jgi:predicted nucleotidyltransferase
VNPLDPNVQQLQIVAGALQSLREKLVFVGGCVVGILITDPARPPVRATQDVDLVAETASKAEYYAIAADLRRLGFQVDPGDEVICRWRYGNLKVDVMASREGVLNFTNRWYADAIEASVDAQLPDRTSIRLITAPYFIATKLEAFYDRGHGDYMSHDIEDIVNVIDGRDEIIRDISAIEGSAVAAYLRAEVEDLISDPRFLQSLPSHFQPNAVEQQRIPLLLARLREIAGL